MATGYVDPNADGSPLQWTTGGAPQANHYNYIDDATRQPTAPDTADLILTSVTAKQETYGMATLAGVASITSITVWAYCIYSGTANMTANIYVDAGWKTAQNLNPTTSWSWKSVTFNGSWDQSDLDDLQIRFVSSVSGGNVQIAAAYAEVTYTPSGASAARSFVVD